MRAYSKRKKPKHTTKGRWKYHSTLTSMIVYNTKRSSITFWIGSSYHHKHKDVHSTAHFIINRETVKKSNGSKYIITSYGNQGKIYAYEAIMDDFIWTYDRSKAMKVDNVDDLFPFYGIEEA